MKKFIFTFFLWLLFAQTFGQSPKRISTYLSGQYTATTADRTLDNNPWGIGLGFQTFFTNKTKFKPTLELTGDIYLMDDKVLRENPDGTIANTVDGMVNLFIGSSYHLVQNAYLSFMVGPSFINGQTLLGIKPSLGIYFSENQRWTVKCSYITILNRGITVKENFGSLSLAVAHRLF